MKPIFIASTPNVQKDDLVAARRILLQPSKWHDTDEKSRFNELRNKFAKMFSVDQTFLYNTGRSALYSILKASGVKKNHEVITQAYTCLAVPTAIIWAKAKPVYADINSESLNPTADQIRDRITDRTKAVIIQHTFGKTAEIERICKMIYEENSHRSPDDRIILIEDLAHSLGNEHMERKLGKWGDAAILSFGQEKVISCTQGGLAFASDSKINENLTKDYTNIPIQRPFETLSRVLHPLLWNIINKTYFFPHDKVSLGKALIVLFRTLGLLKTHADPNTTPNQVPEIKKLSNAQALMLIVQLKKLTQFNRHRHKIAEIYNSSLPKKYKINLENHGFLRFPLLIKNPEKLNSTLRDKKIITGNWYNAPIHPKGADQKAYGYKKGSCPNAEKAAKMSINLPTQINVSDEDAKRIAKNVK